MSDRDSGGPAFPPNGNYSSEQFMQHDGMSLRDYFAGQALVGMGTWMPMPPQSIPSLNTDEALLARAKWAYSQADAMLKERAK